MIVVSLIVSMKVSHVPSVIGEALYKATSLAANHVLSTRSDCHLLQKCLHLPKPIAAFAIHAF